MLGTVYIYTQIVSVRLREPIGVRSLKAYLYHVVLQIYFILLHPSVFIFFTTQQNRQSAFWDYFFFFFFTVRRFEKISAEHIVIELLYIRTRNRQRPSRRRVRQTTANIVHYNMIL